VESFGDVALFLGPNIAWRKNQFSVLVTGLWQATTLDDEADFQLRTIFSIDF
jgi:hypothetical protein